MALDPFNHAATFHYDIDVDSKDEEALRGPFQVVAPGDRVAYAEIWREHGIGWRVTYHRYMATTPQGNHAMLQDRRTFKTPGDAIGAAIAVHWDMKADEP